MSEKHQSKVLILSCPWRLGATSNMIRVTNDGHRLAAGFETRWTQFFSLNVLKI